MPLPESSPVPSVPLPILAQSRAAAVAAASDARVRVVDESSMDRLRDVADLFVTIWGTSPQGAPIPSDLLRSIVHAGCNVTAAYDSAGVLCGAAAAIISAERGSMYSLIAGVRPGIADKGVGFALKQHQRAWGLERGLTTMNWTFDPLVSRNARFNLTKLGAYAADYELNFYGVMDDEINTNDESDRLVAVWRLDSERAAECSEARSDAVELPPYDLADVRATGPDGLPALIAAAGMLWCRVPTDIVALRAADADLASAWRRVIRQILTESFASGHTARGVSRNGWYRLAPGGPAPQDQQSASGDQP